MGGLPGHLEPMAQLVGHAVAVVKDLFDRLGLEFFGVTLTAHTGSYWTGNRRLSTVYKTLGDSTADVADSDVIVTFNGKQAASAPTPANAGVRFSRSGSPDAEVQRQFKETERTYGGKAAYDRAKAAGKTKLTHGQWVQVRTPNFKAWFGDWEAARARQLLDGMTPVSARLDAAFGEDFSQAKAQAKAAFDKLREATERDGFAVVAVDGREIAFSGRGFKEVAQHAADRRVLSVAANLKPLFESAVPLYSTEPDASRGKQQVAAFHYYGVKADFGKDGQAFVLLEVVERSNGDFFYDADATSVEEIRAASSTPLADQTKSGAGGFSAARSGRLSQWWSSVNPADTSKVVDSATGEPLVVYHGTNADFSVFRDGVAYFTPRTDYSYIRNSDNNMPVFLAIKNPYRPNSQSEIERIRSFPERVEELIAQGYDGMIWAQKDNIMRGASGWGNDLPQIVAFKPAQIKSVTGNNGQFDPANPDIRYSRSVKPVTNPAAVKMRRAMVQRTVDALAKGWAKAPNVTVVDSMQDERVSEAVRKADAAQRSQGAMGVSISVQIFPVAQVDLTDFFRCLKR